MTFHIDTLLEARNFLSCKSILADEQVWIHKHHQVPLRCTHYLKRVRQPVATCDSFLALKLSITWYMQTAISRETEAIQIWRIRYAHSAHTLTAVSHEEHVLMICNPHDKLEGLMGPSQVCLEMISWSR